jgi:DNA-binding LytR/AlgR family response regulator
MNIYHQPANNVLSNIINPKKRIVSTVINKIEVDKASTEFIRFEEKKERYIWAHPDEICFVKSADHYVKSLIKCGNQKKWMCRHSTLKELLGILPEGNFIRLNKFYLLNLNYFSHINESEKLLYFNDDFSIAIPHRISPFLRHLLKSTCT